MSLTDEKVIEEVGQGKTQPFYLVTGESVLAEPAAARLAEKLATAMEASLTTYRRPANLTPVLDDLRTYSLFSSAKVALVFESAVLADRAAAAALIDEAQRVLPVAEEGDTLTNPERQAAGRLLQVLHLFGLDPYHGQEEEVLGQLPAWLFQGGRRAAGSPKRSRGKRQAAELRTQLANLLRGARRDNLRGWAEHELADLAALFKDGLPKGHALVMAESHVAADHPLVTQLAQHRALIQVGRVEINRRGGWEGLEELSRELERQTGTAIHRDALLELAQRTLRKSPGWGKEGTDPNSTARLAAEYRKLSVLAGGNKIDLALVREGVEDRGQEDVWQLLDAVGEGKAEEALSRLQRLLRSAEDPAAARLAFFTLLADFCRQLTAVRGMMQVTEVPAGEGNYNRFKSRFAPRLQGHLPDGSDSPLAGLHPYRLHRIYRAACRLPASQAAQLPSLALATELRLKGESGDPDGALAHLLATVAQGVRDATPR